MEPTSTVSDSRSDAALLQAARTGDAGAFGVLYERHAGAALVVARQYTTGRSEAEDVVADSFAAVWSALQRGTGPSDAFRAYLFTAVRRCAAVYRNRGRRAEPTADLGVLETGAPASPGAEEPALEGFERSVVARAFHGLPERWQAVLWHSEVEGLTPAQIAPLLGLSANSTAALAYRAREGLRQAYLQEHLGDQLDDDCRAVAGKLGSYVRGGLGQRDTAQVEAHLDGCGDCRALVLELRDVNHGLRGVIAPLVLGIAGLGALDYALPTGGGLAAGTAALGAGAGAGAAAGTAATGTAAAGTAAAGTAAGGAATGAGGATGLVAATGAAGAAGAVGAAVAGAAGAGGATGGVIAGITAFIAAIPTSVVATVAGVVVVGGVAIGLSQLGGGDGGSAAPVPSTSASLPASPEPTPAETDVAAPAGPGDSGPTDVPATQAPFVDTGAPAGSSGEQAANTVLTTPEPSTTTPPPAPQPARLEIGDIEGGLAAGATALLAADITNTGDQAAANVFAIVGLPEGVRVEATAARLSGRFAVHGAAADWTCTPQGGDVRCDLLALDAGQTVRLELSVSVPEEFDADEGTVTWAVGAEGIEAGMPKATVVAVKRSPARLQLSGPLAGPAFERREASDLVLAIRNAGGTAAVDPEVLVDVPDGLAVTGADEGWACKPTAGDLRCTTPFIGARATRTLALVVTPGRMAQDGVIVVTPTPGTAGSIAYQVTATDIPGLRFEAAGPLGVTEIGAPLLGCQNAKGPETCWKGASDNNSHVMVPVDVADARGAVTASSSAKLDLPEGAKVRFAGLYWSANRGPHDAWLGDLAAARLAAPGGAYAPVRATSTTTLHDSQGREYYQSFVDVTAQVAAGGAGAWSVADVAMSADRTDTDPTYYAGWSLVVVYESPELDRALVDVVDTASWVARNGAVDLRFATGKDTLVRVGVVAWEGDRGQADDGLRLDGTRLTPLRADGSAGSFGNAFDSSATGFGRPNSLGVDAKGFDEVVAHHEEAVLHATTTGDQYLLGAVTLRVSD